MRTAWSICRKGSLLWPSVAPYCPPLAEPSPNRIYRHSEKTSIALYDSTGEEYFHLDEKNKKITIETKKGDIDILCKEGTFTVEAKKIVTKASDTAEHEATNKMTHKSKEVVIKGDSKVDVDGGKIELN